MAGITASATPRQVALVRVLWLSTFVLVLIAVAIVTRRVLISPVSLPRRRSPNRRPAMMVRAVWSERG